MSKAKSGLRRIRTGAVAAIALASTAACSTTQSFTKEGQFPVKSASGTYNFSDITKVEECSQTRSEWIESNFWKQVVGGKKNILSEEASTARRGEPDEFEASCADYFGKDIEDINPNNTAIDPDAVELDATS